MKREGRQHGMVRSYRIIPPPLNPLATPRFINRFESPPVAGIFTKVSTKPTNHSKFTGKCSKPRCNECHLHPAGKAKDKSKGNLKIRTADDDRFGFSGISAVESLDLIDGDGIDGGDYEDDELEGEDDKMSFCEVGIEWEQVEEDWCLVAEK